MTMISIAALSTRFISSRTDSKQRLSRSFVFQLTITIDNSGIAAAGRTGGGISISLLPDSFLIFFFLILVFAHLFQCNQSPKNSHTSTLA